MSRIEDISELTPQMQTKVNNFLLECYKQGVDCYPFETYRSQERQNELYAQGRTKPGNKVTWTLNSRHKLREACDFAFGGPGQWHWNGDWDKMIKISEDFGLESLAPREKAHLQDDGKPFNREKMNTEAKYYEMEEAKRGPLNALTGDDTLSEKDIKGLINIASERSDTKLKDEIVEEVVKEIIALLKK